MNQRNKILVVNDNREFCHSVGRMLRGNYDVLFAESARDACRFLSGDTVALAILDPFSSNGYGLEIIEKLKNDYPDIHLLVLVSEEGLRQAFQALQKGARDILVTPFGQEEILKAIRCSLQNDPGSAIRRKDGIFSDARPIFENIVGQSPKMLEVFDSIARAANSEATILIQGESGTGKELAARAIHRQSRRKNNPFVVINCAAIPASLMESEIFGYNKGAFTGADRTTAGKMEIAQGGTVCLDDIDSLDVSMQGKLLRLVQEKEFEPLGGTQVFQADVRFIAATNKDLNKLVQEGSFREDLYYRLHVVPLHLPSLRERKNDIPLLVDYFIEKQALKGEMDLKEISPGAMRLLTTHSWPGNVRELENMVERLCATISAKTICCADIPYIPMSVEPASSGTLKEAVRQFECTYIFKALEQVNGNKTRAAEILGIHRNTLMAKTTLRGPKKAEIDSSA